MRLAALLLVSSVPLLTACGDCPESRYDPGEPERTELQTYRRLPDGRVTMSLGDPPAAPLEIYCDVACHADLEDPSVTCAAACADLTADMQGDLQECAFDAAHQSLRCLLHYEARGPSCNCSLIDC